MDQACLFYILFVNLESLNEEKKSNKNLRRQSSKNVNFGENT